MEDRIGGKIMFKWEVLTNRFFRKDESMKEPQRWFGQFDPPLDQVLYNRYFFRYNRAGTYIECGAFDGIIDSTCYFFENTLKWNGLNIEAYPDLFKRLAENRPNSKNVFGALSSSTGHSKFTHAVHPVHGNNFGNGSLAHTDVHMESLKQQNCELIEVEVPTTTYQDLIKKYGLKKIDLFVLDVEGHEVSILETLTINDVLPLVFCIETGHVDSRAVTNILELLGYRYDGGSYVNSFFLHEKYNYFGD
ncbi:MAG: FkbM family methyltransferase [Bdellovibrionales bacterium]|nr:FkbM family methyltransferase [Bdellovibrionales bacterium]